MERSDGEGLNPSAGSDQTSFGSASTAPTSSGTGDTGGSFAEEQSGGGVANRVKSVASSVREKASGLPALLADGLEAGAQALRQQRSSTSVSSGAAAVAATEDSSIAAVTDTLASGMQSSAEWLRDADFDKLKTGVEEQVKEHPARSLLVALGAGYLIGKVLRR
jgi:hypothetical protein